MHSAMSGSSYYVGFLNMKRSLTKLNNEREIDRLENNVKSKTVSQDIQRFKVLVANGDYASAQTEFGEQWAASL